MPAVSSPQTSGMDAKRLLLALSSGNWAVLTLQPSSRSNGQYSRPFASCITPYYCQGWRRNRRSVDAAVQQVPCSDCSGCRVASRSRKVAYRRYLHTSTVVRSCMYLTISPKVEFSGFSRNSGHELMELVYLMADLCRAGQGISEVCQDLKVALERRSMPVFTWRLKMRPTNFTAFGLEQEIRCLDRPMRLGIYSRLSRLQQRCGYDHLKSPRLRTATGCAEKESAHHAISPGRHPTCSPALIFLASHGLRTILQPRFYFYVFDSDVDQFQGCFQVVASHRCHDEYCSDNSTV
ncbi:hypothetical protein KC325_g305 [Hortaea werneckii]|nr:hypothetical protein KC325_g305 [Hortaea werneckii]